ncbi:MAG: hypothetical protein WD767_07185 [Alphaproteobacteria bacterium]
MESGPAHIRDAVQRVLESFAEMLKDRANETDGKVSVATIQKHLEAFRNADASEMQQIYTDAWLACQAIAESAHWAKARRSHFERIMVKCFADLLPRSKEPPVSGRHLSRRIVPGFINALQQMMGQEIYNRHSDRVDSLVETMRAVHGEAFSWEDVYSDPICLTVVEDVLIGVAHHFSDMAKRRNWMIDLISAHMPATGNEIEKAWYFGDGAFHTLMNSLYGDLRDRSLSHRDREGLIERYGEEEIANLSALFAGLAADHADLQQAGRI